MQEQMKEVLSKQIAIQEKIIKNASDINQVSNVPKVNNTMICKAKSKKKRRNPEPSNEEKETEEIIQEDSEMLSSNKLGGHCHNKNKLTFNLVPLYP